MCGGRTRTATRCWSTRSPTCRTCTTSHVPYDPIKDFALIGMITDGPPLILIVNANEPYKSVAELVAYAKANPSKVSFGTSGPATSPAIAVTQLNNQAKTHIVEVPYRGSAPAAAGVAGRRGARQLRVLRQCSCALGQRSRAGACRYRTEAAVQLA